MPVTMFVASDNVGVTGYLITTSASPPSATDLGWTSTPPTNFNFAATGDRTAFGWAKDSSGNVSAGRAASVVVYAGRQLNDTGITANQCYQIGRDTLVDCRSAGALALNPTQDGMLGRDVDTATNKSDDGRLGFSFSAIPGGCVYDNISGLTWEVKATDSGLRDKDITYTNYGDGRPGDASAFVAAVNAVGLCGYSDWRLPTADELQSIVDYGIPFPGPTIDTDWFSNTRSGPYWSSSPNIYNSMFAWRVYFNSGIVADTYRSESNFVRLVRSGR